MPRVTTFTNPGRGEIVEVYRGVPILWTGASYLPDLVGPNGGNVSIPRCNTLIAARRFIGFALKRGARKRPRSNPRRRTTTRRNAPRDVPAERNRRRTRTNPAKPLRVIGELSHRALEIRYVHLEDGDRYVHKFEPGVTIQFLSDGSARFYRPDGRPLWKNFR